MEQTRPIKVAQVIGMAINGGVESCIMNYYRNIDRNSVQFDFLVESTSKIIDKNEIESMGGHVIIIPSYKNPFKYVRTLTRIFKENKYDIVHSNMNALSVFTLKAAKKAGIKVRIAHSHSTSNNKEVVKTLIKNMLRPFSKKYATDYFACGELAGRWLFGNKTFDAGKVTVINNGVDIEKFKFNEEKRNEMRKKYNLEGKFVVGHIGRFVKQKNHTFLIDVFYELQKKKENAILFLIGDGPLRNKIEEKIKKLGIEDKVILAGIQKNTEDFYQAFDCFVLPSLYEGLPVVGVEAQINGLNCFFSNKVTSEIIIENKSILVSLEKKEKIWANEIISVNVNSEINERKESANKFCKTEYDIKENANRIKKLYFSILGKEI